LTPPENIHIAPQQENDSMTRTDKLKAAHAAILAAGPFTDSEAAALLAVIRQGMGKGDGEAHILAAEDAIFTQLEADALEQEAREWYADNAHARNRAELNGEVWPIIRKASEAVL
jgi:hypothetical protein